MAYTNKNTAVKNLVKYWFKSPLFDNFRDDKEVVLMAMVQGRVIEFVSDRLKDDPEVVLAAIKIDGAYRAYNHVSDRLLSLCQSEDPVKVLESEIKRVEVEKLERELTSKSPVKTKKLKI